MKKITRYAIIRSDTATDLAAEVEHHIIEYGWQPFGSLCMTETAEGCSYAQAIVQYAE